MIPARRDFRDRRNHALAILSELGAPLLRCAARVRVGAGATPPSTWRRGLILGYGHIGDVLYRTASLDALTRGLPECEWFYLSTPYAAELLQGNPAITGVLPWMTGAEPESALRRHRAALRDMGFDAALCTENVRTHAGLLMAVALRIRNRVAFTQRGFSGLATHGIRLPGPMPRPVRLQRMMSAITGTAADGEPRPRVYPSSEDMIAAAAEWARVISDGSTRVIACSVTTRQSIGAFPPELFEAILKRVVARDPRARIVLFGSNTDDAVLSALAERIGTGAVVSAGRLGVRAAVAFLARCDGFLGSDSGPRHLANAAGIPVFFIRNLGTSEIEAGPYVSTEEDVAPRGEFLSPTQALRALRAVDAESVAARIIVATSRARDTRADTRR